MTMKVLQEQSVIMDQLKFQGGHMRVIRGIKGFGGNSGSRLSQPELPVGRGGREKVRQVPWIALPKNAVSSMWLVAVPNHHGGRQRNRDGRKVRMTEEQQLIFASAGCKTEVELQPTTPNPEDPSDHTLQDGTTWSPRGI